FAGRTAVVWDASAGLCARVYDTSGKAVTATFLVSDEIYNAQGPARVALNESRIAVLIAGNLRDSTSRGIFARVFDSVGTPLSALIPVAVTAGNPLNHDGQIAMLADGTVLVAYVRGSASAGQSPYMMLRRVNPDFSMGPPVQLLAEQAGVAHMRVLKDGRLLIIYALYPSGDSYVRAYDTSGNPLAAPVLIDSGFFHGSAAPDGRFLLGFAPYPEVQMRLYGVDWQPIGPGVCLPLFDVSPIYGFSFFSEPFAYDANTLWFGWEDPRLPADIFLSTMKPFVPGDLNADGALNNFDIDAFVLALLDPATYEQQYPGLPWRIYADLNADGAVNNFDIDPFVECLLNGDCP
ncbi:MAG: hypothetical protein ACREUU_18995, partial [Gammaproteobacteria bacterium]